ncbi:glycoside hydrolase family 95 protein [Echinicola sediminis]
MMIGTRRIFSIGTLLCILVFTGLPSFAQKAIEIDPGEQDLNVWYASPAKEWTEAIPIGNGYMGAMIFGEVNKERIQLNEGTLYSGDPDHTFKTINVRKKYPEVMELMEAGEYQEATEIIKKDWLGRAQQCFQPMGDVWIDFDHKEEIKDYKRSLDLGRSVVQVSYKVGEVTYTREYFASYPDHLIVVKISADQPGKINCELNLSTPHKPTEKVFSENDLLILQGKAPGIALRRSLETVKNIGDQHKYPEIFDKDGNVKPGATQVMYDEEVFGLGMAFDTRVETRNSGGQVVQKDGKVKVENADEVVFLIAAATSYNGFDKSPVTEGVDESAKSTDFLKAAANKSYESLLSTHTEDYQELFDRVKIKLDKQSKQSKLPTDQRVLHFSNGKDQSLVGLYFQFGRYLMISGSRPGGQPLNLQGIWNDKVIPPWASAYTMNINLEMNYWPAELTNLAECQEPLFTAIDELAVNGAQTAKQMFGNQGWLGNHNMTVWRQAEPVDMCECSFWPMVAGWLMSHKWEHYLFSADKAFLRTQIFPLLEGAVLFYKDWLIPNKEGYLVTPVGHSPENKFIFGEGGMSTQSPGPTMDLAIIRESFSRYLEACDLLGYQTDIQGEIRQKLGKLLPYQIGQYGQLQEWQFDFEEQDPEHRHISHLYGFHPGNQISWNENEDLVAAVKRTMERRGDKATGWSMGWKVNIWARLHEGDKSLKLLTNLLQLVKDGEKGSSRSGTYSNLFDAHPPFQIDGNFGATAGIAEMLLQSHEGWVELLPALPTVWKNGAISGLKARGGFEVDMDWSGNVLKKGTIIAHKGGLLPIKTSTPLEFEEDILLVDKAENDLLSPITSGNFLNHYEGQLPDLKQKDDYEYYIQTKPGDVIVFTGK